MKGANDWYCSFHEMGNATNENFIRNISIVNTNTGKMCAPNNLFNPHKVYIANLKVLFWLQFANLCRKALHLPQAKLSLTPLLEICWRKSFITWGIPLQGHKGTFRRTGATWAFDSNVPLEHIIEHGNWKSDAVWHYLQQPSLAPTRVPSTFAAFL